MNQEEIDKVWNPHTEPDLPLELLDYRCICEGFQPKTAFQVKLKEQFDKNFERFMREKRVLESEYKEHQAQQAHEKAAVADPGTEAALQVAREWLERHGEQQ